ncbi:Charged multivesicular body protein 5 [Diplonema papillatum]|nr:Charged multivesicular body protein 5 [Diplonema papillatum]
MKRLFGVKADAKPAPTLDDTSDRMDKRIGVTDGKIKRLDDELNQVREQLKRARPGPQKNRLLQRGAQLLKQKRLYEGQRDQVENQRFNMDQMKYAAESVKDTMDHVQCLTSTAKELKSQQKTLNIDKIAAMQDELQDLYQDNEEIQEILGRSYAIEDEMDDDEVAAELMDLEDDYLASNDTSYLDDALSKPSDALPVGNEEETDPARLEQQLGL